MKSGNRKMQILISSAGLILAAAVVLMGTFQIKAAVRTGTLTGESLKRNLAVSIYHAGQDLFSSERLLISMLNPLKVKSDESEYLMIKKIIDSWYEETAGAQHIKGVYFRAGESGRQFYRYFPDDDSPVQVDTPPKGLFMVPHFNPGKEREILIDIDKDILYGSLLPAVLDQIGTEYGWQIIDRNGVVLSEKNMEGIDYSPEIKVGLGERFLFLFNDIREFQSFSGRDSDRDRDMEAFPLTDTDKDWGSIEIFFTQGPLNIIVNRQIILNLAASMAALLLIIGGYLLLYRLYRKSEIQRLEEQEFVSTISHELRTPLAVISSAGENISRGIIKGDRLGDYGRMITRESRRLEEMIEGVLFYSGLQKGSGKVFIQEQVDLLKVLDEIRERYSLKALEMDVQMEFDLPAYIPQVKAGRQAFSIVAGNLILNALIHAYPPGFHVKTEDRKVFIHLELDGKRAVLDVEDKGCGIPVKEQKKVFRAFVRGENSRRSQIPGSGLGLHIAQRVAELSRGILELDSRPAGGNGASPSGTKFRFILPLEIIGDEAHE
ncbi:MAG: HAMP domain-containing histidine kinase [Spirochaetales bacterium]|nr:HAMP domain-containing histidine kinase [Spirochaetales bacterium]